MSKAGVILFILIILILAVNIYFFQSNISEFFMKDKDVSRIDLNQSAVGINVTKENLIYYLEQQPFVIALPSNAIILLKLYNFDSGEQVFEKSYIIKKASVKEGTQDNYDMEIIIHSKYLQDLGRIGFCDTIKKAQTAGDFSINTKLSQASLAWKYRSMMKYKSCLGL